MSALGVLAPDPARAQYFGQNKVQYERFDFQIMRTPNFDIYHYPEERAAVEHAARLAEYWRTRLTAVLGLPLSGRQPLVLYASQPHFSQTQVVDGLIGEGTGGVTDFLRRRMVLPFASSLGETSHVLGHEMVHAFQFDLGGEGALALPLWFVEGMAEYLSLGSSHVATAMWMRSELDDLPAFTELDNPRYFPYRFGHAAWAFLAERFGERVVGAAFLAAVESNSAIRGIEAATGADIDALSAAWHASLRTRYARSGAAPEPLGRDAVSGESSRGPTLNVSPALSPDGKWLVYLSERSQYSLDIYLTEAATGRVVRRLTTTATDPHLESLQFVASAGAWDAQSRRFAFITVNRGTPTLTIVDVAGNNSRERAIDTVDEAWQPAWSPDGKTIAFAGMTGGLSDLFTFEVESGAVRRLTQDGFSDLQPAWSPSGTQIAFVTDRFTSNLETLVFGSPRLGLLTVATGAIEALPSFERGKHINPQWNAGGDAIFLVSDSSGVSNVYRLDLSTTQFLQVTQVVTGVAGITEMSPAISYAPETNELAYSVFDHGGYDIRLATLTAADHSSPNPLAQANQPSPLERGATRVPPAVQAGFPVEPYRSKLALDFAGASGGVGGFGSTGGFASGGVGLNFSDVLGEHTIGAQLEVNGGLRDLGGQVLYVNRQSRWNWGGVFGVNPYVTGGFGQRLDILNGQSVIVDEEVIFRQTDIQARALAMYPFSRAMRFEIQGGGRRIGFDRQLTTRVFAANTGDQLSEDVQALDTPSAVTLGEAAAALVYDQTAFGPTGPIAGQRYRFEVTPTLGSLQFTSVMLDYRRYLQPVRPFTVAVRGLHLARYGADAADTRLSPLFLGYPSLVRGYDVQSFDAQDCGSDLQGTCPAFDRLLGTRLLVGNIELRFPVVGLLSRQYRYGPVPLEGFLFADSGVAWTAESRPRFANGDRSFVSAVGAGVRVNVLGYAVLELAGARALNRQGRGWRFVFNLAPGY